MKVSPLSRLPKWRRLAPVVTLLVVALALVAGPARQALAQEGAEAFAVYCETDKTLTLYKDEAANVPSEGGSYGGKDATRVFVIDETVARYGESPFAAVADAVENVEIAASGTAGKIAPLSTDHWFEGFERLQEVDGWENADTSKVANTSYMYYGADLSHGLSAPEFNTSSVTNMSHMFEFCSGLTAPDFSSWDTSRVTDMTAMFRNCRSLSAPKLSGWDVSGVTSMQDMFYGCGALASADLSSWEPSKVTSMRQMFYQCTALTSLDLSGWDTPELKNLAYAFFQCAKLASLDLEGWSAPRLDDLQHTFDQCTALTSLDLSSWGTTVVEDMAYAFNGCTALEELNLDNVAVKSSYGEAFDRCGSLVKVTLGDEWAFLDNGRLNLPEATGRLWYRADTAGDPTGDGYTPDELAAAWDGATMAGTWVLSDPIAEPALEAFATYDASDASLTIYKASDRPEVGDTYNGKAVSQVFGINEETAWFSTSPFVKVQGSLRSVTFAEPEDPENRLAPTSLNYWFRDFRQIRSIDGWENVDGSRVKRMEGVFEGCEGLQSIDLSGVDFPNVSSMSRLFESCTSLRSANLSGIVGPSVTNISNLFLYCSALADLDVSGWDTSGVTSLYSFFQGCKRLKEVDLSSWNLGRATNANWMFTDSAVERVTLGEGFRFVEGRDSFLPERAGKLWYRLDAEGSPAGAGYTGEGLAAAWDGAAMAGTWQLADEPAAPEPIELTGLSAPDSLTYGETLTVTFTPRSGDELVASGTATLRLGDAVLAVADEPQADGSFSLSYDTAEKDVALGEQTLTVTFESAGYEAATATAEVTLSAKPLTAEVTSGLDKTWDGSDEVDGLEVELLGALEGDDVTVSATGTYSSSDAGVRGVTLALTLSGDDAAWYAVFAPAGLSGTIGAASIAGELALSGTPVFGETLTATYEPVSGEQVTYAWTRDGQVIDGATGRAYVLVGEDVGARIAVVVTASDANHAGSVASEAVTVAKAAQDAPAAPVASATSPTTIEVEALAESPAGARAEYSIDGGKTWQEGTTFGGLDPETAYTVIARYQELGTHAASEASEGTTVSTPAEPLPTFVVSVSAEGQGAVDGGGAFEQGATVTVTATPAEGHHFVAWLVDGEQVSTEASHTFVVEADVELVARFEQDEPDTPEPDDPDVPEAPAPDTPAPDDSEVPGPAKPAGTRPGERNEPELPATGDAGAATSLALALAGACALGVGACRRRG